MKTKRQALREKQRAASYKKRLKFEREMKKAKNRLIKEAKTNRNLAIRHAWEAKLTLTEIGKVVGLTKQGVSWVLKQETDK